MKTSKIPKGAVTESKRVAVTKSVSADNINEFISYCNKFYGKAGIYKDQLNGGFSVTEIKKAVLKYLKDLDENPTWGDGDSLDRERIRQILQPSYSLLAKGGKMYANGGNTPASLDDLKKGDRIHITFDSSIKKDHDKNLIIKNKTVVGVGKSYESNKVSMTDVDNPNGVKYFAYKRKGDDKWRWAMGDMAISNVKMHKKDAMSKGGMTDGMYYVVSGKQGKVISKGFVTEEEAKVKMYRLYERNNDISMAIKRMAKGGMIGGFSYSIGGL